MIWKLTSGVFLTSWERCFSTLKWRFVASIHFANIFNENMNGNSYKTNCNDIQCELANSDFTIHNSCLFRHGKFTPSARSQCIPRSLNWDCLIRTNVGPQRFVPSELHCNLKFFSSAYRYYIINKEDYSTSSRREWASPSAAVWGRDSRRSLAVVDKSGLHMINGKW